MSTFGERLREERKRLGLSQVELGQVGGVLKQAQLKYESGERSPDSAYLAALAAAGVDVQYIVTGIRSDMALTPDERELLNGYRALDGKTKRRMRAFILDGDVPSADIEIHAPGGTVAGRDMTITNKGRKR